MLVVIYMHTYIHIYILLIKLSNLTNYNIFKLKWIHKNYLICYKDVQNILNKEFSFSHQSYVWRWSFIEIEIKILSKLKKIKILSLNQPITNDCKFK